MDFAQRLIQLEAVRDWKGLADELEKGIASEAKPAVKAGYHIKLGRIREEKLLQSAKALKHFQDAYKLDSKRAEALQEARSVYWTLSKINMVQKLLELELKGAGETPRAVGLLIELGDVLWDAGDYAKAASSYAKALTVSGGQSELARASLGDVQLDASTWKAHLEALKAEAAGQTDPVARSRTLLRAARIAHRFAPPERERLLLQAYEGDPSDRQVAALYEQILVDDQRVQGIVDAQARSLSERRGRERAEAAFAFGVRWILRHQNQAFGERFLLEALTADPGHEGALASLRELWGEKQGQWARLIALVEKGAATEGAPARALAEAGTLLWRQSGDLLRARGWFEKLAAVAPGDPSLAAFEAQIGERLTPATPKPPEASVTSANAPAPVPAPPAVNGTSSVPPVAAPPAAAAAVAAPHPAAAPSTPPSAQPVVATASPSAPPVVAAPVVTTTMPEVQAPVVEAPPAPAATPKASAPVEVAPPAAEAKPVEAKPAAAPVKVEDLIAKAQKQEQLKRYNEFVKTLIELAEAVEAPSEKIEYYAKAADLYTTKFANAAEASRCYEAILALDPANATAIAFLRQSYEKRRDWEKLIGLMRREAQAAPAGALRNDKLIEIARIATERVKKPELCIELWSEVLANDAENVEALTALSGFYERTKEWPALASVLRKQVEVTADATAKQNILAKLATLCGDRLNDDAAAVEAWRMLLALNPQERRAQEALKKKYLALGLWDDLEVFYAESGKWDEFIRVLEAQEAKETDEGVKIGLLAKIAELWVTQKGKPDRATRAYEKILTIDPKQLRAAEALVPIYTQAGNARGLATALEVKLQHGGDSSTLLALHRELGALYETKLNEPARAFERYASAFELAPSDPQGMQELERVARGTGAWETLIAAYATAIERAEDAAATDLAISLRLRRGAVLRDELSRPDDALVEFQTVHSADAQNADAISALEQIYRQSSRYSDLLSIYEQKLALASGADERRALLLLIAELYEGKLGDPQRAIATYGNVLADAPTDDRALAALDRLYRAESDWVLYADILRRRIELATSEDALIDLKLRLGSTLEKYLGDATAALGNYREVLLRNPSNQHALAALEAMLGDPALRADAAGILENIYEGRGEWEKLIGALEILVEAAVDSAGRVALLRKVAHTANASLGDARRAMEAQARALREDPANLETRKELEALAEAAGAWSRLDEIFSEVANGLSDAGLRRDYWLELASIHERLGKVDAAAKDYGSVLAIDPADQTALGALDALYLRTGRFADRIGVFRRRIDLATEHRERETLYAEMADVYERQLGKPEDAIAAYQEVLSLDETSKLALVALDGLFNRLEKWQDLASNLEAQRALATDEREQIALMLRLAELRESRMGQPEAAIEIYSEILHNSANAQALAALERLGQVPAHELAIAEVLEPIYRQAGAHQKLIGVHEVQVRRTDDPSRRVDLLHQIAALHEDAGADPSAAFDTYARALDLDSASEVTRAALVRLATTTNRFSDLATVLERRAAVEADPELASALFTMSAGVYEHQLNDHGNAIKHYQKVLSIDPTNLGAADALVRTLAGAQRYAELSGILQRKAEIVDEVVDKKAALFQSASIEHDMLGRREEAIRVYGKVLELDGEDLQALDALIKLELSLGHWDELLAFLTKKADLVHDARDKKTLYYQMGAVFERELHDVARAIDTYQRVLEIDPDDIQALGRLDVLYQAARNWPELLSVLQREGELASEPAESISYQYRVAELYERQLDDLPRALELYRELLVRMPDHAPTLLALEGVKAGTKDPLGASLVLGPVYEANGQWANLVSVLEVQVAAASDEFRRVELLQRIAHIQADTLGDVGAAFATYSRAVSVDIANEESLGNLERLAIMADRWVDVAALYEGELKRLSPGAPQVVDLGLRLAQIYETQLEDVESAIARYRGVLASDPENQPAIFALDRLLTRGERWIELAQVLEREIEITRGADELLELKFRLGQVRQTRLNDLRAALDSYRDVLASSPDHPETLGALEGMFASGARQAEVGDILAPLYETSGNWEKLAGVLEAQLAGTTDEAGRQALFGRLHELQEENLGSPQGALAVLIRAIREYPNDPKLLAEIERVAGAVPTGWEDLANAYADVLGLHADTATQTAIGKRLARVFEEDLADVQKAEETFHYVLGIDPDDVEALEQLDRIYSALSQYAELAEVLEQRIRLSREPGALLELNERLGHVYEERLGNIDGALRVYRRIFDQLDPRNEGAIAALERIYAARGASHELKGVLERQLDSASSDDDRAAILAKIAHLLSDRLDDAPGAIATWKKVLELRGEDAEALGALSNLHERLGQWSELCDVLERHYDAAVDDNARVEVLLRRAKLFAEKLNRQDSALEDYQRVLDVDYENLPALRAMADIWRQRNDPKELVGVLQQTVYRASDALTPARLGAIYREMAALYEGSLADPSEAIEAWRKLIQLDPRDFEAMASMEKLLRAEERWTSVIDVKMSRADAYEAPADKMREYLEVAAIWENQLGDKDRATESYERILELEPTNELAFSALEGLHDAAGRGEPLIELYLARLETRTETKEKTKLLRKVARVFEEQLEDAQQAFDALLTALELDFTDMEVVRPLERVTQLTGRWGELVQTVNGWLQQQTDPGARIALSLRLAKWYGEDLGHPEYAQPFYQQVLALDPNNASVLRQMASFFRKTGQFPQQGQMLTNALKAASSDVDRKEILTELGELLEQSMGEVDQGMSYYKRALDIDPLHLPALDALERIYSARNLSADLVSVLTRKAKASTESDVIARVKLRTAGLYETALHEPEKAGQMYREVLEIEGSSLPAMRGLERVYTASSQWADLVRVLESQLEVVTTERERIDLLMKVAEIQEAQFLKPDLAAERLEQIVEIDPGNEPAFALLERCYRRLRQWHDLVSSFDRHITATHDRQGKIELWGQMARVYADELQDLGRASDAYLNVISLDENNVPALDALAKLHEKQDDAAKAIEFMTRVADLTVDGKQRVEMYYRIGRQLDERLGDRVAAQERYEMALDLDPNHLPTLAAMRAIAVDAADWDRAARLLEQEQQFTEAPRARAKLLVELGKLRRDMLGEPAEAANAFELALASDPDNEEAALPLVEEYVAHEEWQKAEPLAEMLARKSGKRDRAEQHRIQSLYARVLASLGKNEAALKAYQAAHMLDLTSQETTRGLAEICFKIGDWAGALTAYQKVMASLGEEQTSERGNVYFRIGQIKQAQQQPKQALTNFEKALSIDPSHREALDAIVALFEAQQDWKQVCHYKRAVLDTLVDGVERFELLVEIGDIWAGKENNLPNAIEAYEEALDLEPENHILLHKLLQLYQKAGLWDRMIDCLQRIADLEPQPDRRSRYLYTMAQIYRDKVVDLNRAVDLFNETLDLNPGFLEAFERINKILTAQKEWSELERAYRKMLHRVAGKGNNDLEYSLWHALGLIYRDRLNDPTSAIETFRMSSRVKPEIMEEHMILADLLEQNEQADGAIDELHAMLRIDGAQIGPYKKLYALELERKSYDRAWCVAAALSFLRKADDEEQAFFERFRPKASVQPKSRLDNEQWFQNLFHEDQNPYIGKIFEMVAAGALRAKIEQLKAKKETPVLDARFRQDPMTSTGTLARTFGWAAQVLGIACPLLYVRTDVPGGLVAVANEQPASVAGQAVLTGMTQQDLAFIVGKHLAMYRGEHYIKTIFPTVTELTVLLFSGIKIVAPDTQVPPDLEKQILGTAQALRTFIQPIQLEGLRLVVKKFLAEGAKANIKRWMQCVDITAARTGLLLCGDLETAKKIIASEQQQPGELSAQDKVKELIVFSVSDQYAALRQALGIEIEMG